MTSLSGFNASNVEPAQDFEAMPAGEYVACIVDSEMKPTNAGDGSYLSLTLQILEGEYANRKVWNNLNLDNPNAKTVEISERVLSSICHACAENTGNQALLTPEDSEELYNIPMIIRLEVKEWQGNFNNEVKSYKVYGGEAPTPAPAANNQSAAQSGNQPAAQSAAATTPANNNAPAATSTGGGAAPWNRK